MLPDAVDSQEVFGVEAGFYEHDIYKWKTKIKFEK